MLLVDTNILVAAADTSTPEHAACAAVLDAHADLLVPAPVAVETAWMIESRLGVEAEATFVDAVATSEIEVVDLTAADWARCRDLIVQYADLRLGLRRPAAGPVPCPHRVLAIPLAIHGPSRPKIRQHPPDRAPHLT